MDIKSIFEELDGLFSSGRTDEAEPFLRRQQTMALAGDDTASYIAVSNELIGFLRSQKRHRESTELAEAVISYCRSHGLEGSPEYATTLLNAATAYRFAGDAKKALSMYKETEAIYNRHPHLDPYYYAGLYNNISAVYTDLGQPESAAGSLRRAAVILEAELSLHPEYRHDLAVTYANLCGIYRRDGRRCQARNSIEKACDTIRDCPEASDLYDSFMTIRQSLM